MTETSALLVSALSEGELIARFTPLLPRGRATLVPTGDDAAVVAAADGRFVVSTDVLVEDHHFRRGWGTARDVGARAAAQNLADVAAMGAVPTSMVVGLVLPPTTPVRWVEDLARGLADVCAPLGVGVDGGDLSAGRQLVVAVTVHGDLEGRDPVLRSGARPGHVLAHAGAIGRAAAGLAVLGPRAEGQDDDGAAAAAVGAFLRPAPPYAAGPAAADAGASAMMDVSDGLLRDAGRLAHASGVEIVLDPLADSVPGDLAALAPVATRLGVAPESWLLTGGEDHGLLATFPEGAELPAGFRRLGAVRAGAPGVVTAPQDAPHAAAVGWDHFRR
ncbi:thiamine-phosphate kinase [Georgenia satyanarayanai]|uniref:Thiamine-monophosphate kinase n=1 Tax=Georgenia satyanarayanai TaxID=860221 RepID=A0A2Y9AWV9_9MICO|nr:thiamine-phosphate kinase [Georgenia satyanarayanai]PYF96305.1 thiamine-phosphate kinase [Georgenia satyanarayanai]SSA47027.1 thiamine-phosphate kinase [Georgenia satyanarayanai]